MKIDELLEAETPKKKATDLEKYIFSPGDLFWEKKFGRVKLAKRGDILNHDYLKKFKDNLNFENYSFSPLSNINEALNELKKSKNEITRIEIQNKMIFHLRQYLWDGEFNISTLELIHVFHNQFYREEDEAYKKIQSVCDELYRLCALKASLSCSIAIVLGHGHYLFLKDLYYSQFVYFYNSSKHFTIDKKDLFTGKAAGVERLVEEFESMQIDELKLNYPVTVKAMSNVSKHLSSDAPDISWGNYTDLEELLFFIQRIFHESQSPLDCMSKLTESGEVVFESGNLTSFLKILVKEYKINYERTPRFFNQLEKTLELKDGNPLAMGA